MATTASNNNHAFLVNTDVKETLLLYNVHVESVATAEPEEEPAVEISVSTHPITQWFADHATTEFGALALSGGTILGLVHQSRDTVVLDVATQASSPGPRLRDAKVHPAMLPVGDDTVVVIDTVLPGGDYCFFEALRRVPGGGWHAAPLPNPPVGPLDPDDGDGFYTVGIVAYFVVGTRVWVSIDDGRGTFSLDVEHGIWSKEGDWVVSFVERGLFVPELRAVIGFSDDMEGCSNFLKPSCHHLCALDVEARPPVVRHMWEFPVENREEVPCGERVSLAYLGNGRFCMCRSVTLDISNDPRTSFMGNGTCFTVLDLTRSPGTGAGGDGELQLATRGRPHTHVWPYGINGHADFL